MRSHSCNSLFANRFRKRHCFLFLNFSNNTATLSQHAGFSLLNPSWRYIKIICLCFAFYYWFLLILNQLILQLTITASIFIIKANYLRLLNLWINILHLFHPFRLNCSTFLWNFYVFKKGAHKISTDFSVTFWSVLNNFIFLRFWIFSFFITYISIKRVLQSINHSFRKHLAKDNSSWIFFLFSDAKSRLLIGDLIDSFWTNERKKFWIIEWHVFFLWWVSIEKCVQWFWMTVNV